MKYMMNRASFPSLMSKGGKKMYHRGMKKSGAKKKMTKGKKKKKMMKGKKKK